VETNYTPDRKLIPDTTPITDTSLIKYVIGADGIRTFDFGFTFTPNSCGFYKVYTLSVVTYPENVNVPSFPWVTVDNGQDT
jgi:hypothetical protein